MVRESDFFNKWSLVLLLEFKGRTNIFTTQQKFTNFIYIFIYIDKYFYDTTKVYKFYIYIYILKLTNHVIQKEI